MTMAESGTPVILHAVTPAAMAEALRRTGYRAALADNAGVPQVQSAAQGLGFIVSFGNPGQGGPGSYVDCAFQCWIGIQGELPDELITAWNQGMRFARMFRQGEHLVVTMDVVVAGGVTEGYLSGQCELWDRVIRDFILHLRRPGGAAVAAAAAGSAP